MRHVARIEEKILLAKDDMKKHLGDLIVEDRVILKLILRIQYVSNEQD
jgi:hypothetical protein